MGNAYYDMFKSVIDNKDGAYEVLADDLIGGFTFKNGCILEKRNVHMEENKKDTHKTITLTESSTNGYNEYCVEHRGHSYNCLPFRNFFTVMPAIVDIIVHNDKATNLPCVTVVKFADGTMEKCSCSKTDSFSLEMGISICVTKKLLSMKSQGNGHNIYNKIIDKGLKIYRRNRQAEVAAAEKKIADKLAADRKEAKRRARRERKKKAEDERQIACYMEAMRRVKAEKSDKAKAEKKK